MIKSWGIYISFGKIKMTKNVGSLWQATKKYDQLLKRKKNSRIMIALVPIYDI